MVEDLKGKPTKEFARWASQLNFGDIPAEVVEYVKLLILDSFGIGICGSTTVPGRMLTNHVKEFGGCGKACIWGDGFRSDVVNVPMANGSFTHALELEDTHRASNHHATCVTLPPAMAFADQYGASGKEVITAATAGIEVSCRIGIGVKLTTDALQRGWHAVGALGGIGGAVTFGKLLRLDKDRMAHAISLGGTQLMGIWSTCLTMSKPFHAGKGGSNGVLAALLARRGFTGGHELLEAKQGSYSHIMCDNFDLNIMTEGLGEVWEAQKIGFKPYPSRRILHTPIDAVLKVVREHKPDPDQIETVTIISRKAVIEDALARTWSYPKDVHEAKHCMPFIIAVAVAERDMSIDQIQPATVQSKAINEFASNKVKLVEDPELTKEYPRTHTSRCVVKMKDGAEYKSESIFPPGEPENPMSREEIITKFRRLASRVIDERRIEELIERVADFDKEGNVAEVTPLLHL